MTDMSIYAGNPADVRGRPLTDFASVAQDINDSDQLMSIYAAPEWDELSDDGQQWVCGLVRETIARAAERHRDRYRLALMAIQLAAIEGRICDDVAWFDKFTTLYDFIEDVIRPPQAPVIADLFKASDPEASKSFAARLLADLPRTVPSSQPITHDADCLSFFIACPGPRDCSVSTQATTAAPTAPTAIEATDEDLDKYLPESIRAAKRCGMQRSAWLTGWFVPWSPRNDNENAEGPWSDWVELARKIIGADEVARALHAKGASDA